MSLLACCTRVSIRALGAPRAACTVCGETEAAAGPSRHRRTAATVSRGDSRYWRSLVAPCPCVVSSPSDLNASTGASVRSGPDAREHAAEPARPQRRPM